MLELKKIKAEQSHELYMHMTRDFPANERPKESSVERNLRKEIYNAFYLADDNEDVGYAIITAAPDTEFALINFLAIFPKMRSKKYGSAFVKLISERWQGRTLVIEVENPAKAQNDEERIVQERRIAFYERLGFRVLETKSVKIFGVDMLIMANTADDVGSVCELMSKVYAPLFKSQSSLKHLEIIDI